MKDAVENARGALTGSLSTVKTRQALAEEISLRCKSLVSFQQVDVSSAGGW